MAISSAFWSTWPIKELAHAPGFDLPVVRVPWRALAVLERVLTRRECCLLCVRQYFFVFCFN